MDSKIMKTTNKDQNNYLAPSKKWKQETGDNVMNQLPVYDDVEPLSEADAQAEWDWWQKQAIMDDKAQ